MKFIDYLNKAEQVFKFRIKALFPLKDENMDLLEKALQKYRPISVSTPKKMMFQTDPLGFTGSKCAEVYMCDVELTVPISPTLLQFDLREVLGLNKDDASLKVFSNLQDELGDEMEFSKREGAILDNDHYEEIDEATFEDYYGGDRETGYNAKLVAYLKKINAEKAKEKGRGNLDARHPLTKWADQPELSPKPSDTEQSK